MTLLNPQACANNNTEEEPPCTETGKDVCNGCHLVQVRTPSLVFQALAELMLDPKYCSKTCQTKHWPKHKPDCKSVLSRPKWIPGWELERRPPIFMECKKPPEIHGLEKYLWGNMPAIDVCRLEKNEGLVPDSNLRLLFAGVHPLSIIADVQR